MYGRPRKPPHVHVWEKFSWPGGGAIRVCRTCGKASAN